MWQMVLVVGDREEKKGIIFILKNVESAGDT